MAEDTQPVHRYRWLIHPDGTVYTKYSNDGKIGDGFFGLAPLAAQELVKCLRAQGIGASQHECASIGGVKIRGLEKKGNPLYLVRVDPVEGNKEKFLERFAITPIKAKDSELAVGPTFNKPSSQNLNN